MFKNSYSRTLSAKVRSGEFGLARPEMAHEVYNAL